MRGCQVLKVLPHFFGFHLGVLVASIVALCVYNLETSVGVMVLPTALLVSYIVGLVFGIPALWLAAKVRVSSLTGYLILAVLLGVFISVMWLLWQMAAGASWVDLMRPLRSTGAILILAAVSGVLPYWYIARGRNASSVS